MTRPSPTLADWMRMMRWYFSSEIVVAGQDWLHFHAIYGTASDPTGWKILITRMNFPRLHYASDEKGWPGYLLTPEQMAVYQNAILLCSAGQT